MNDLSKMSLKAFRQWLTDQSDRSVLSHYGALIVMYEDTDKLKYFNRMVACEREMLSRLEQDM